MSRYRNAKSGQFRVGRRNGRRNNLRGAPPNPSGLVQVETTLTPAILPRVYRNVIVTGSTPCIDRSRLSHEQLLMSLNSLVEDTGAVFKSCNLKADKFGVLHVVQDNAAPHVSSSDVFHVLQSEEPCYITISFPKINDVQFRNVTCFAPPPRALRGFLYRRVFIFVSRAEGGVAIYPHRDLGGGPLVFGASTPGGRTYFALTGPTHPKESGVGELTGAFDHLNSGEAPKHGLHYASLSHTGDYVAIPSGY